MSSGKDQSAILLGDLIAKHKKVTEERWLQRVLAETPRDAGIELTDLRDGIPAYLAALIKLLREDQVEVVEPRGRAAWSDVAREHGITRVRIGFNIGQLIREFTVLRQVIRDVVRPEVRARSPSDTAADIEALLADVLDSAISAAVEAYVEARDYDARRRQAENIGFLTHELRNPLTAAVLAVGRLRLQTPPAHGPALDAIDACHRRLSELIDSVLLTERLEVGKVERMVVQAKLGPIMERALAGARAAAEHRRLVFRAVYDPQIELETDPQLTGSAVQNIVDNAVKYTDAGFVEIVVEDRADAIIIHVRDTCHGLSPEELGTIFEPFQRGVTRKAGTGLGLAIARRAVELQGGTLQAESPGPSGCHFWITLPKQLPQ